VYADGTGVGLDRIFGDALLHEMSGVRSQEHHNASECRKLGSVSDCLS
jgi:hypothetical protein